MLYLGTYRRPRSTWPRSSGPCWPGSWAPRSTCRQVEQWAERSAAEEPRGRRLDPGAAAEPRRVRAAQRAGPGRHGRRLPRLAAVAGPAGGAEVPAPRRRPEGRGPVPPRDPRPGPGRASRTWSRSSPRASEGDQWFYAMELVEGATLAARLRAAARPRAPEPRRRGPRRPGRRPEHGLRARPASAEEP